MFVAKSHLIRRLVQLLWQSATQFVGRKDPTPPWLRRAASQSQSALLSKLPPEIRLLVWKQCLGGMRLHLYLKQTRCRSLPCRNMDITNKCYGTCWSYQDMVNQSLLLTCRQVYVDSVFPAGRAGLLTHILGVQKRLKSCILQISLTSIPIGL